MWIDWFAPAATPVVWVVLSTLGMYITILLFARWSGVRSFAQMSAFDIAVTIAIGSLLATTVASRNPPLIQGMAALVTLYGIQLLVSRLRKRFRAVERVTDNRPILLMGPGGKLKPANLAVARVTEDDLRAHLRAANVEEIASVQAVVMEGTGSINVLHGAGRVDPWLLQGVRDHGGRA
ncbi:DUF421 domain-containing protein [Salinisphaera sp. P385]|uniref:DUF421 domain-containing protein n=1 Tax=Spectribacter acetivorans TaxID=3075603 RepID=A0ABU3B500_9GAMM|nr:YetF domain-containing protein [Salinisphaera sp. P385]MDT0617532.1 DUF421 domain-containing protein [Salinisphaera sp. P385]